MSDIKFAFFGTPDIAVFVLEELANAGYRPSLIVTNPDAPKGRKHMLTPPPTKVWAAVHAIPVLQPESLKDGAAQTILRDGDFDLFIVAAYGKLIPKDILDIPKHGTLNVHPSLLPALRGASPIRSAILQDIRETGVTIMLMDELLDHGPILAQENVVIEKGAWPLRGHALDELLARKGGVLLVETIPQWLAGEITLVEQDHARATFCTKISKEMGELDLSSDPYQNLLKIRAFDGWPGTYFFAEKNGKRVRVKIVDAELAPDGSLRILRVIPEGRKEMMYDDFSRT
jgi:methionyl-tRNA formyltransferase